MRKFKTTKTPNKLHAQYIYYEQYNKLNWNNMALECYVNRASNVEGINSIIHYIMLCYQKIVRDIVAQSYLVSKSRLFD